MSDDERSEREVPELMVAALNEAQRRAVESRRTLVMVVGDCLVEVDGNGTSKVLKRLPPRPKATVRRKRTSA